ncbi:MAG TPA: hypothetical protein VFA20_26050 [Myxococcaceae bacterium]|nr:hypothetical protein [Myxococcaceae bacterium]
MTFRAFKMLSLALASFLAGGAESGEPLFQARDTVSVRGGPTKDPKYIDNAIRAVSILGWGGPFRLDSDVSGSVPEGSIYLERAAVHLDQDPLECGSISLDVVFRSSELAEAAVSRMARDGSYTYYVGPAGYIFPTVISQTTAPAVLGALRFAVERERMNALSARDTSIQLLFWYIGARNPIQLKFPVGAGLEGFSTTEQSIILEARRILASPELAQLRLAQQAGRSLLVRISGRLIQYEPGAPCSGMTLFGENGFLLGREAFASESELVKTLLHELHRLSTSVVHANGASMATVRAETQAASAFAEKAFKAVLAGGRQ